MAGKPVHLKSAYARTARGGRDGMWEAIRKLKQFSVDDIASETDDQRKTIHTYLKCLEVAGYIVCIGLDGRPAQRLGWPAQRPLPRMFKLVNDVGVDAPRVRKTGEPVTQGAGRENMWRTIKILGEFTRQDLIINASTETFPINTQTAKEYLRYLTYAGYLVELSRGHGHGCGGTQTRYRFLKSRNTGARAPMIQRVKRLYDPNLGQVVWPVAEDNK